MMMSLSICTFVRSLMIIIIIIIIIIVQQEHASGTRYNVNDDACVVTVQSPREEIYLQCSTE